MRGLPRRIEHALDVTVQSSHDADARERRRPVLMGAIPVHKLNPCAAD
jgi:hypothetical protein